MSFRISSRRDLYAFSCYTILYCVFIIVITDTVMVTAGTYEPQWKRAVWRLKIWFNPPFLWKCLYQVRVISVFTVFRLLTDFVCLYAYEFWLSLWKIVLSSVILLLAIFTDIIVSACKLVYNNVAIGFPHIILKLYATLGKSNITYITHISVCCIHRTVTLTAYLDFLFFI